MKPKNKYLIVIGIVFFCLATLWIYIESTYTYDYQTYQYMGPDSIEFSPDAMWIPAVLFFFTYIALIVISVHYGKQKEKYKPQPKFRKQPHSSITLARSKTHIDHQKQIYKSLNGSIGRTSTKPSKNILESLINKNDMDSLKGVNLTSLSPKIHEKIDKFAWEDENQKIRFIKDMIALTPKERVDFLNYMVEHSKENEFLE